MVTKTDIKLFEERQVRSVRDEEEQWYFSIVDVVAVLTDSKDPQVYWRKLKQRLKQEGNESVTSCHALKMLAADGKLRLTDVATTEQLFRLIQSIPSPKAEPFKLWMAEVAAQRLDQLADPELSINQALEDYKRQTLEDNMQCAAEGGNVARVARKELEAKTGKSVVSPLSAKRFFEGQKPKEIDEAGTDKVPQ